MVSTGVFKEEKNVHAFQPGEKIFSEGDSGDYMYAVLEGEVEIRKGDRILETIPAGGVFGEMGLIEKLPRTADAVAVNAVRVAEIGAMRFYILVQHYPFFALEMLQLLSHRLRKNITS